MKKSFRAAITGIFVFVLSCGTSALAADLSSWAEPFYRSASGAGLVSYSIVTNNMKGGITREEFCELTIKLYKRLSNEELPVPENLPFTDTNNIAVAQAYNYGIVNGTSDTTFTPDRLVTRQEMAKILVSTLTASEVSLNIAEETDDTYLSSFTDSDDVSAWARSPISTVLSYGIMTGLTDDTIAPTLTSTREQAIVSINRAYSAFESSADIAVNDLPVISLPNAGAVIDTDSITISWSYGGNASLYHVIIKDSDAKAVLLKDVAGNSITVSAANISRGNYSVIVGAILADGSETFSLPVDFTYNYKKPDPTPAPTVAPTPVPTAAPTPAPAKKPAQPAPSSSDPKINSILSMADSFIGTPYLWGGTTPDGFDCSGFVQYVYSHNGYNITRTTYTQWDNDGVFVDKSDMKPGDLIYFGTEYGQPSHVGMYVGNGTMIHAPHTGDVIKYVTIESGYYNNCFMGAKRIIN